MSFVVERTHPLASLPKKGTPGSAGYDLTAVQAITIVEGGRALVPTGLVFHQLPEGCYARIAPRSGLALNFGIGVMAGVIDRDYRGPVGVVLINQGTAPFGVRPGDRIAQVILERYCGDAKPVEEKGFSEESGEVNVRGTGGFGSTGR